MVISRFVKNSNGKGYLEVDGKPFLYNAAQSWYPPEEDYSVYVEKTAEVGFTVFSFWLYWRLLEPRDGEFDFSCIDAVIDLAVKHNIRLDIIWAGTNFCDHLDYRWAPEWVFKNKDYHLKNDYGVEIVADGYDMGPCFAADIFNNELFDKEARMVAALFEHLAEYDTTHRVICIQIENEINMQGYWGGERPILDWCNRLGKIVKESPYSVATRVNINEFEMDAEIDALAYIDGQGLDTYTRDPGAIRTAMQDDKCTKFKHIAENDAVGNVTGLMLTTIENGGFFNIYRVDYDVYHKKPGVYDKDMVYTEVTHKLKNLNFAMNNIAEIIAKASPEQMVVFNSELKISPIENYFELKMLGGSRIAMSAEGKTVGLAIYHEGNYYFVADGECKFGIYSRDCEFFTENNDKSVVIENVEKVSLKSDRSCFMADYSIGNVMRVQIISNPFELENYRQNRQTKELERKA